MKRVFLFLLTASLFTACGDEQKTDNEKAETPTESSSEAAEAADTGNLVDKAQENLNKAVDTLQSKGGRLIEAAGDTLQKKVIEPVKADVKKAGEKIKEKVNELKEKAKEQ
jgi:hypothetical protein